MSMYPALVSICVPIYGVEKYVERCVRSLFNQTYPHIEYIFVNDCCNDTSIDILNVLLDSYPDKNVHIINHERNRGLAAARNTAIDAANGEFVIHVDSDDWVEPYMVEVLLKKQRENDADIVSGNAIAHFRDGTKAIIEPNYTSKDQMLRQVLQLSLDHVIWRRLIRKSLYTDNHIQAIEGVDIGEDHHTLPRLVYYANVISRIDDVIYNYNCENENSYMSQNQTQSSVFKKYQNDIKSINILIDFFTDKNAACVDELYRIKTEYVYHALWLALKQRNGKDRYAEICVHLNSIPRMYLSNVGLNKHRTVFLVRHYHINRVRVLFRIALKKITGKKHYKL